MVSLTDRPDMTLDVYRGRKTTMQQQQCTRTAHRSKMHAKPVQLLSLFMTPAVCICQLVKVMFMRTPIFL